MRRNATVLTAMVLAAASASAQPVSRLRGHVTTEQGDPIANAEVRVEAFYGYAAGAFAGQRTFKATTDKKGDWNVLGVKSGVWAFEVIAPGYIPESVVLPIQMLTTVSSVQSGMAFNWSLVLKPIPLPPSDRGQVLLNALEAAREGAPPEKARSMLERVPDDADADYLAAAGRIALLARDQELARALFLRALQRDPSSYRAALGIASTFMLARDFDSASRVFDAARNRTHDKDEVRFITIALSDLATIKVR
jgi:tetratricopeptide (TPR) repeat protein